MTEATIIKHVRQECVFRDGYCRIGKIMGTYKDCRGASEWAHFGEWKRWKTMGQDPAVRHCTEGSLMACTRHHQLYDNKFVKWSGQSDTPILINALSERHADGPLAVTVNGVLHIEAA